MSGNETFTQPRKTTQGRNEMLQGRIVFHRLKKPEKDYAGVSRRMFLMTTAMAGVTVGTMTAGVRPGLAAALDDQQSAQLLRMVQDIYPHPDLLPLSAYEDVVATVLAGMDNDESAAKAVREGLTQLNAMAQEIYGSAYADIEDPDAREGLLRTVENEGFFQGIRWKAYFGIYDNKELWPLFGYEGSSVEHGGYIDRGFSDITFVPQGPTLEERLAEVQN
ncbi:gluconate 2-dehydrogenase subunit 3 family protein [Paracoccus methylarcula]|uniref:Transcriptional initiation protein Tat n=1 Tax=Paracoccus methylarcula TaxID=72022 RepID=A0A3R7N9T9_9RHOB|nr:gluconate 2-dehydrogenase subunit 3 family protein [Paracoccus methylarcula]RNF32868.1 transcriptional initiation protein Tat [Paracoccus methylarcula]